MAAGDLTFEGTATADVPTAEENAAATRAALLDLLDAPVSSRASAANYTAARAALLDHLVRDVPDVSALAAAADVATLVARLTVARAAALDLLDVAVSTRAEPGDIPPAPDLSLLDAPVSSRAVPADVAAARDAVLAAVLTRLAASDYDPVVVADVAAAVWDELIAGHDAPGSAGAAQLDSGGAADPLTKNVPADYLPGMAGHALGRLRGEPLIVRSPVASDGKVELVQGDDYAAADARELVFTGGPWPGVEPGDPVRLTIAPYRGGAGLSTDGEIAAAPGAVATVELTAEQTRSLVVGDHHFAVDATSDGRRITLQVGNLAVVRGR